MDLFRKVNALLTKTFPPPDEVDLRDEDGIIGMVVSKRFRRMETIDRQTMIWTLLGRNLEPKEQRRILTIVAVTPEEQIGHASV